MQSAAGAAQAYNNLKGLSGEGQEFINPTTGQVSTFVNSGDPVTGTDWLASYESRPGDTYWLMSSGLFDLASGDTQTVVIALVVGQGANPIKSISWMRYYDRIVQNYYDNSYQMPAEIPAPKISVSELDERIFLTWDSESKTYESCGYKFEGYNVYEGETEDGPWHKIAVFDVKNYITIIRDYGFSQELGYFTEIQVAEGEDSGVQHYIDIENDWQGRLLVNGRQYYYAVTAYANNPEGYPRVLETEKKVIIATPHKPDLKTTYNADIEQDILVTANAGPGGILGDISGIVEVVDPSRITGHDYRIDFIFADSDPDSGYANKWKLTDMTMNALVLDNQNILDGNDRYSVVDGFKFQVKAPKPGEYGISFNKGTYAAYGTPYSGVSFEGNRYCTGVDWGGRTFFGGGDIGNLFLYGSNVMSDQYVDVKIHFVNDQSKWTQAYTYDRTDDYRYNGLGTFPGWAEDISDPDNPRRLNICFVENDLIDHRWDPIAADAGDDVGGHEYLFIMVSDYANGAPLYNDTNWGPSADVLYAFWMKQRSSHTVTEEWAMIVHAIHPVKEGNNLTFSTDGLAPTTSNEIARTRLDEISIFPNPYCGFNKAERNPYQHFVTFINLPEDKCTIRIFSLSGQLVKTILHDNGTVFEQWDLSNDSYPKIPVASGMYIAHIEVPNVGVRILKLGVIMPQESYIIYE